MTTLRRALRDALEVYESPTEEFEREPGFEDPGMDEATRQLRKSCRAVGLARRLLDDSALVQDKNYTVVIELGFNALERAAQAALARAEILEDQHTRSHFELLKDSHRAALWGQDDSDAFAQLYMDYRSQVYYRDGVPSRTRAEKILGLAVVVHMRVTGWNRFSSNECLCV